MSLAGGTLRRIGLDHNPLRRPIDRVEAWIVVAIVLSFLLIVPATVWLAGRTAYTTGLHNEQVERLHRYRVHAVLLADAGSDTVTDVPVRGAAPTRTGTTTGVRTPARWTSPDGSEHRGVVLADERARAGQWVAVWANTQGDLTDPPQQRVQTWVNSIAAGALAGVGALCLAGVIRLVVRRTLDARRMAQWEEAWWRFEPRWTGRS